MAKQSFSGYLIIYKSFKAWFGTSNDKLLDAALTYFFPTHPFSIGWKYPKTVRFSDVFRGWRKGAVEKNGLIKLYILTLDLIKKTKLNLRKQVTLQNKYKFWNNV